MPSPLPGVGQVSIHAFRGEGDKFGAKRLLQCFRFQSTPSGGKATLFRTYTGYNMPGFQSTPSGGKATGRRTPCSPDMGVSIHAFRGEGDLDGVALERCRLFQSTPSGGKATSMPHTDHLALIVSIHAFRGEGDARSARVSAFGGLFQSTPSGGKATSTGAGARCWRELRFNPRLPGGRRRRPSATLLLTRASFNPRLPGGRRPAARASPAPRASFNPRLPGGRRRGRVEFWSLDNEFQSTPSGGKATAISRAAVPCSRQIL